MILAHVGDSRAVLCQQGRAVRDLAALTVTNGPQVVKGQPSTWPQQMAQVRLTEDHKPGAPGVPTSFEGGEGWWTQASKFATALLGFNLWEWRVIFCPAQKPEPWKLLLGCQAGLMDNSQCAFVCAKNDPGVIMRRFPSYVSSRSQPCQWKVWCLATISTISQPKPRDASNSRYSEWGGTVIPGLVGDCLYDRLVVLAWNLQRICRRQRLAGNQIYAMD